MKMGDAERGFAQKQRVRVADSWEKCLRVAKFYA